MSERDKDDFGPNLIRMFRKLSAADKSVIIEGVRRPGSHMLTSKGSDNDLFWSELSRVKWTERVELDLGIAEDVECAAWLVTELGAISIPVIFRKAAEQERAELRH